MVRAWSMAPEAKTNPQASSGHSAPAWATLPRPASARRMRTAPARWCAGRGLRILDLLDAAAGLPGDARDGFVHHGLGRGEEIEGARVAARGRGLVGANGAVDVGGGEAHQIPARPKLRHGARDGGEGAA